MNTNLKVIVVELAKTAVCLDQAILDKIAGKGILVEAKDLWPAIVSLPAAIGDAQEALTEIKTLSPTDMLDLEAAVAAELANLPQENIQGVVTSALNVLVAILSLVTAIKAL